MKTAISYLFLAYFVILFAERVQSLIRIVCSGESFLADGFTSYVNVLTVLSLVATVVLLATKNGNFFRSLLNQTIEPDYLWLCITAGVILLSGMVHTEYTIAPIQFASYGALIVAMALKTVENAKGASSPFLLWYSLATVVLFSMAIPVMYRTAIANTTLFHVIEAITAFALVVGFTYLLVLVFLKGGCGLLCVPIFVFTAVADAVILWMRWTEKVNGFVLTFAILSFVAFLVGLLLQSVLKA